MNCYKSTGRNDKTANALAYTHKLDNNNILMTCYYVSQLYEIISHLILLKIQTIKE